MATSKISEIRISNLFGYLNHTIPLQAGGITFIHGPNGCGKTTVLKLVASIFSWNILPLFKEDFEKIEILMDNKTTLTVSKNKISHSDERKPPSLTFSLNPKKEKSFTLHKKEAGIRIPPSEIEELFPQLVRVGAREWQDSTTGQHIDYREFYENYREHSWRFSSKERPDWLEKYISSISLHFIKTQRLLNFELPARRHSRIEEQNITDVIQIYSREIKELISKKLAEQATLSQRHDRSFPERLLSLPDDKSISEEQIRTMYANTEKKIQELVEAGLIEEQKNIALPKKKFEETEKKVLSLYLQDIDIKLSVFDELKNKIQVFLDVISPKLRTKKFSVTRANGFSIELKSQPGKQLTPSQLSSGEQHQIVLFYELIFRAEKNAFFLIDEPEISLHIDWQRSFISDIHKISELGDRSFLVATHSPQIIGNYRNLAIPLEEGILDNE
ncbi:AAA family ATPase [Pectobacterium carotovorum]|uniref:AAA family ATPase n=1 Tax=Pectobacterium carotovorum TaxID=554 RepID=UPI00301980C7